MKCANCDAEAAFEYRITLAKSVFYCGKDLPKFLNERKKAGLLKVTQEYKDNQKSALEVITTPEVVEPEVIEEAPKTKKKASPKKKTV